MAKKDAWQRERYILLVTNPPIGVILLQTEDGLLCNRLQMEKEKVLLQSLNMFWVLSFSQILSKEEILLQ